MKIDIITSQSNSKTFEFTAAENLRDIIINSIPTDVDGTIYVAPNITLKNVPVRDFDLVVWGESSNCILKKFYSADDKEPKKDLLIKDFIVVIELKEHPKDYLFMENSHLFAKYADVAKDVTKQSEGQRFSMKDYLSNNDMNCCVSNAIWLKSVTKDEMDTITGGDICSVLASEFKFQDLICTILAQGCNPIFDRLNDRYVLSAGVDIEKVNTRFSKLSQ